MSVSGQGADQTTPFEKIFLRALFKRIELNEQAVSGKRRRIDQDLSETWRETDMLVSEQGQNN